ncbi:MAG: 30S ribosomal protein S9 [Microgenomates group bacterium]
MARKKEEKKSTKKEFTFAVGRRKEAVARVRLYRGKGEIIVNDLPISQYFPGEVNKALYLKPFVVTKTEGKYYATIKVEGGGKSAQLGAVIHGLARALDKENRELYHSSLKKAGLLTRDPRAKERRKPGQMSKARKKKQSPKR